MVASLFLSIILAKFHRETLAAQGFRGRPVIGEHPSPPATTLGGGFWTRSRPHAPLYARMKIMPVVVCPTGQSASGRKRIRRSPAASDRDRVGLCFETEISRCAE